MRSDSALCMEGDPSRVPLLFLRRLTPTARCLACPHPGRVQPGTFQRPAAYAPLLSKRRAANPGKVFVRSAETENPAAGRTVNAPKHQTKARQRWPKERKHPKKPERCNSEGYS